MALSTEDTLTGETYSYLVLDDYPILYNELTSADFESCTNPSVTVSEKALKKQLVRESHKRQNCKKNRGFHGRNL